MNYLKLKGIFAISAISLSLLAVRPTDAIAEVSANADSTSIVFEEVDGNGSIQKGKQESECWGVLKLKLLVAGKSEKRSVENALAQLDFEINEQICKTDPRHGQEDIFVQIDPLTQCVTVHNSTWKCSSNRKFKDRDISNDTCIVAEKQDDDTVTGELTFDESLEELRERYCTCENVIDEDSSLLSIECPAPEGD